jgi:hypothetical protein
MEPRHRGIVMDVDVPSSPAEPIRELDDETIEIELTSAQQQQLRSAAQASEPTVTAQDPSSFAWEAASDDLLWRRAARVDSVCNATLAAVVAVVAVALVWRATNLHARTLPILPRMSVAAVQTVPRAAPPAPPPLVRETNPFDATEVFEFPADTSESQAREAMAALLLQRARDRIAQGVSLRHPNLRREPRTALHEQAEISVTRLSAGEN